jgi:hypothetical protein
MNALTLSFLMFRDGLASLVNSAINRRNVTANNTISQARLTWDKQREIYRTGIGNKIACIKGEDVLDDTIIFESESDREYYEKFLKKKVQHAANYMIAFGRSIITIHHPGDDIHKPLGEVDRSRVVFRMFSGDMVTVGVGDATLDLNSPRYWMPESYNVRGEYFHWTRVIDFTYVRPVEYEAPAYMFGGISEFELIYDQIIADGIVQRSAPAVLEKSASVFYKVKDFKSLMMSKKETELLNYYTTVEDMRSSLGATVIDLEDEVMSLVQTLTGLPDTDNITLRRLAMVTSIPLPYLIGENVKGLNSTGDTEEKIFNGMRRKMQRNYYFDPINLLMARIGLGKIDFSDTQGETANERAEYEGKILENAMRIQEIGEDSGKYLEEKGIIEPNAWDDFFEGDEPEESGLSPEDSKELFKGFMGIKKANI